MKVVNINDDSTYGDVAEAIIENEAAETQEAIKEETPEVEPPKPKARAKRVPKPKAVVDDTAIDLSLQQNQRQPRSRERSEHLRRKWLNCRPWWRNLLLNRRR